MAKDDGRGDEATEDGHRSFEERYPDTKAMKKRLAEVSAPFRVEPGTAVSLMGFDPGYKADYLDKQEAQGLLQEGVELLGEYQTRLWAEGTRALLIVLQARDAAGKDSTIKHVMTGVNPQGVDVRGFRQPSAEERMHDFLWRHQKALPERGRIGIFNRSHYEEVIVTRVHPEILESEPLPPGARKGKRWKRRYRQINEWERHLVDNGTHVLKFFLNVSKDEQKKRFMERLDRKDKNWKFSSADLKERAHWDEYTQAYEECFNRTSTPWAPWYVVPADHKWFTRVAVAATVVHELLELDPAFPTVDEAHRKDLEVARAILETE
jgi:PPK2 family polyphosphate:nucleotide phosphotransferase